MRSRILLAGVGLLWVVLIGAGGSRLLNYENAPGAPPDSPREWPSASRITRSHDRFALVMLAHPDCPCTRASLAELEVLMAKLQGKMDAFVVFSKPETSAEEIYRSELWKKASVIPGVTAIYDAGGGETKNFGGRISGQAALYNHLGRLVFTGGITAARGHQGDNAGVDAVIARVRGEVTERSHTAAFGCALHNPGAQELREDTLWKK
jgi:hypothetical protein